MVLRYVRRLFILCHELCLGILYSYALLLFPVTSSPFSSWYIVLRPPGCLPSYAFEVYLVDALLDAINLSAVDLLSGLLDGVEDSLVLEGWLCDDACGLVVEGDGIRLDTCMKS